VKLFPLRLRLGASVLLAASLVACSSGGSPDPARVADASPATRPAATPVLETAPPTLGPTSEPAFGPTSPTVEAQVVRIVDGDTIVVAFGGTDHKLRYIGMDTPETVDPNSPVQWMGSQATAANTALVAGKTVYLEKDVSEVDRYDRLLRYVWLANGAAWTLVNLELVKHGVASAISYPPDVKYDARYAEAELVAKKSALGLWGAPPATAAPTTLVLVEPILTVTSRPKPAAKCHPSYTPCLPIVGDLDCPDVRALGLAPVEVIGPDEYRLDRDNDGLGCE
jgi:micrococcal nuclease